MEPTEQPEITRDEIKKEFQLERMILFSDAVFAIVITLMAMEIKLPEIPGGYTDDTLPQALFHLLPVFFAYCVSFFFIGVVWYSHLKMFSLLKDYDRGLVVRNLLLLFFIGLFPFCASAITGAKGSAIAFFLYLGIILTTMSLQYVLYHYILVQRPSLRVNADLQLHQIELRKRKTSLILFVVIALLILVTRLLITNPEMKTLSTMWMILFPFILRRLNKKKVPVRK